MISDNVEFLPPIFMPCFGRHFEKKKKLTLMPKKNIKQKQKYINERKKHKTLVKKN
jgi:hypothetical protein